MRFRITIRGEGVEVRGYVDGEQSDLELLAKVAEPWVVAASIAPPNFDPFKITEPDYPPTIEASREAIRSIMGSDVDAVSIMDMLATLHLTQAQIIRHERALREEAEAELRDRELHHFETEQENERLQKFAEYVVELHHANADGVCARCGRDFPCSENLTAKEALGD